LHHAPAHARQPTADSTRARPPTAPTPAAHHQTGELRGRPPDQLTTDHESRRESRSSAVPAVRIDRHDDV
jgi:hypothetical protein